MWPMKTGAKSDRQRLYVSVRLRDRGKKTMGKSVRHFTLSPTMTDRVIESLRLIEAEDHERRGAEIRAKLGGGAAAESPGPSREEAA